jgi:hypothetical protein
MLLSQKGNIMISLRTLIIHIVIICGMILSQQAFSQIEVVAGRDNDINLSVTCGPASASASASKENFTDNNLILQHKGSKLDNSNNGACIGQLIYTFNQQEGFNLNNASFNNIPCTNSAFGAQCNVNIPEGTTGTIHFNIGVAENLAGTENNLHAEATGTIRRIDPSDFPIKIKADGKIIASQDTTLIEKGQQNLVTLKYTNLGPSDATNVIIQEKLLSDMFISTPSPNCYINDTNLICKFDRVSPNLQGMVNIIISSYTEVYTLYKAPITITSNLGTFNTTGTLFIPGGSIYGKRKIPKSSKLNDLIRDKVSLYKLDKDQFGFNVNWDTKYSDGLVVQDVIIDDNNREKLVCTHDLHNVNCHADYLSVGVGVKASATIIIKPIDIGQQNAKLSWNSSYISGRGSVDDIINII